MQVTEKQCTRCKLVQSVENFSRNGWNKRVRKGDGLNHWCKTCVNQYNRVYVAKNKEKLQRIAKEKYDPLKSKDQTLRRSYKITLGEYNQMLESQGGVCAICKRPSQDGKMLSVDHDHSCCPHRRDPVYCGKCNRGLLCSDCNRAIGMLRHDPKVLRTAAEYLEKWNLHYN